MKRIGNIFGRIVSLENLRLADEKASKGKSSQPGVIQHRQNSDANLLLLQQMLTGKTYRTSKYTTFKIYEPKEREIFRLPYFPDRILHHAVMNILEPFFLAMFTADTYSCIKKRGIHKAARNVRKAPNGKVLVTSETFTRKANCYKGAHALIDVLRHSDFKIIDETK